jgi:hypothetical protein
LVDKKTQDSGFFEPTHPAFNYGLYACFFLFVFFETFGRFGLERQLLYPAYFIVGVLSLLFWIPNIKHSPILIWSPTLFWLSVFMVLYVPILTVFVNSNSSPAYYWDFSSAMAFVASMFVLILVLAASDKAICSVVKVAQYISLFMVFETLFSEAMPDYRALFSNLASSYRFTSIFSSSYLFSGLFLLVGFFLNLSSKSNVSTKSIFTIFYTLAIFLTDDRSIILAFCCSVFFMIAVVTTRRFGFLGLITCILLILILGILMFGFYVFVTDRLNPFSVKSLFNRLFLLLRALEVGNYFLPFGAGPGAQSRAIYDTFVPSTVPSLDFGFLSEGWPKSIAQEKQQIITKINKGFVASPHNTYIEFFITMGVLGVVFSISLFLSQLKCVAMSFYERLDTVPILSVNIAFMILFLSGSFSPSLWFFILFQRMSCLQHCFKVDGNNIEP